MRSRQRTSTRQSIVAAAATLLAGGAKPTHGEIAEQAQVSRATAYRYFARLDPLLREAAAELLLPHADALFGAGAPGDPFERLALLDEEFEPGGRLTFARDGDSLRLVPLIERALAPLAPRLGTVRMARLSQALALMIGAEGAGGEAREVRRWAIDALVAAALSEAYSAG